MLFDDRLATVLRSGARSEAALRTQYRQLLDLLGSRPGDEPDRPLAAAGLVRLEELAEELPAAVQSAILREPGLRLRNRALVYRLAHAEPQAAAAALATAQLSEGDWVYLIPRLPIVARGFLRHRRNLPASARQVLDRLGVRDLVLPEPALERVTVPEPEATRDTPAPAPPEPERTEGDSGIGALVRRIEAFRRSREGGAGQTSPRPLLEDTGPAEGPRAAAGIDFETDPALRIVWAEREFAPMLVGLDLLQVGPGATATLDSATRLALRWHQPLRSAALAIEGPPAIAGLWRITAGPYFEEAGRGFAGYRGRLRRPLASESEPDKGGPSDSLRQVLHELRTPVNAIQGFAEIIQQQMFGYAPNEYRALAAAVGVDAARLLAGFDEVDRLAQLESGALSPDPGRADMRAQVARNLQRLEGVLRPRSARMELVVSGSPFLVPLAEDEAMRLTWRILAMLAGTLTPGELIGIALTDDGETVSMRADLPAGLLDDDDLAQARAGTQPRAIAASMFGPGFAFRLARAEAEAAGGGLLREGEDLVLLLPSLTGEAASHSLRESGEGSAATAR